MLHSTKNDESLVTPRVVESKIASSMTLITLLACEGMDNPKIVGILQNSTVVIQSGDQIIFYTPEGHTIALPESIQRDDVPVAFDHATNQVIWERKDSIFVDQDCVWVRRSKDGQLFKFTPEEINFVGKLPSTQRVNFQFVDKEGVIYYTVTPYDS